MQNIEEALSRLLIQESEIEGFAHSLPPAVFYPDDTGFSNFYGNRQTDGGRSVLYADLLRGTLRRFSVLNGLGCGDSAVEHALIGEFGESDCWYNALDTSEAMLRATEQRFNGSSVRLNLIKGDFSSPSLFHQLRVDSRPKTSDHIVSAVLGRTFGNFPLSVMRRSVFSLAPIGDILLDYYAGNSEEDENSFISRMKEVLISSRGFFLHPLVRFGCR
ncbi:MAG: L-histidine N(alpha)-methyltransferase, partial [Rhodobacter sp.]|nr:L-histidine N(alpha)-methyltransferase [Rhodobacter sp.]